MKLLKFTLLFLCVTGFAQTKVGTIDVDFVISQMPELSGVQAQVKAYGDQLDVDLQKKLTTYQSEIDRYKREETGLTLKQKKTFQDSIIAMEEDIQKFQQNGNQLILIKQEEYLQPLYAKIGASLEKVAKAGAYTQVFTRGNTIAYVDNRFDLTIAVLKDLGIDYKEEE